MCVCVCVRSLKSIYCPHSLLFRRVKDAGTFWRFSKRSKKTFSSTWSDVNSDFAFFLSYIFKSESHRIFSVVFFFVSLTKHTHTQYRNEFTHLFVVSDDLRQLLTSMNNIPVCAYVSQLPWLIIILLFTCFSRCTFTRARTPRIFDWSVTMMVSKTYIRAITVCRSPVVRGSCVVVGKVGQELHVPGTLKFLESVKRLTQYIRRQ